MDKVRVGVIGLGNMGSCHSRWLRNGDVPNAVLTAVCDINPARIEWAKKEFPNGVNFYDNAEKMMKSDDIDAIIIAIPHYEHPTIAIKGFENGLHVLTEKPAGVYAKQVREMNEAAEKSGKVFGMMFNQRTNPVFKKVKELIENGEIGELQRVNWIITNWYRSQYYYNSGGWRATWGGEGGGVLVNQCPHNIDLLQWMCGGLPKRLYSFISYGKYHDIEVDDEVTAYFEFENGATGVFITTTGEAPGTNRLEICGTKGKITVENNRDLTLYQLKVDVRNHLKDCQESFGYPECWEIKVPVYGEETGHTGVLTDWCDTILNGTPMLAAGVEGIKGVQFSNAIFLSSFLDKWVELPVDEDLYFEKLQEKIKTSTYKKPKASGSVQDDMSGTFNA